MKPNAHVVADISLTYLLTRTPVVQFEVQLKRAQQSSGYGVGQSGI